MAEYERFVLPFGGWSPDAPFLAHSDGLDFVRNMLRLDGAWLRVYEPSTIGTPTASVNAPSSAISWTDETGVNQIAYASYNGHLFAVDISTGTMTDRCKLGHYTASRNWSILRFGQNVIATNSVDAVQLFNPSAASGDLITSTTKPRGKYLCGCRGHVILGRITSPSANPRQFWWSALNDAADWEPGSNRAGFGEPPGDAGIITGMAGFEDFFLIFTTAGVYRASYIGGANVWSLQQVGGWHDALPESFDQTIVQSGRDAYYLGRSGPKVVRNGEAVQSIGVGKMRRFMTDYGRSPSYLGGLGRQDLTIPYGARAWGANDGFRALIYWGWQVETPVPPNHLHHLVVYAYSPLEDEFSLLMLEEGLRDATDVWEDGALVSRPGNLGSFGSSIEPGWGLCYFSARKIDGETSLRNFVPGGARLDVTARSKSWRPASSKTQVHAVRPLWRFEDGSPVRPPTVKVTVNGALTTPGPTFDGSNSSNVDADGFIWHASGHYSAAQFTFEVQIEDPALLPADLMIEFIGLEVLVTGQKSTRGGDQ